MIKTASSKGKTKFRKGIIAKVKPNWIKTLTTDWDGDRKGNKGLSINPTMKIQEATLHSVASFMKLLNLLC